MKRTISSLFIVAVIVLAAIAFDTLPSITTAPERHAVAYNTAIQNQQIKALRSCLSETQDSWIASFPPLGSFDEAMQVDFEVRPEHGNPDAYAIVPLPAFGIHILALQSDETVVPAASGGIFSWYVEATDHPGEHHFAFRITEYRPSNGRYVFGSVDIVHSCVYYTLVYFR